MGRESLFQTLSKKSNPGACLAGKHAFFWEERRAIRPKNTFNREHTRFKMQPSFSSFSEVLRKKKKKKNYVMVLNQDATAVNWELCRK